MKKGLLSLSIVSALILSSCGGEENVQVEDNNQAIEENDGG